MPRIPSAADVSPVGAGASRLSSVRAETEDFGLAVATGLRAFGGGVAEAGARLSAEARAQAAEKAAPEDESNSKEASLEQAESVTKVTHHCVRLLEESTKLVEAWEPDGSAPRQAATKSGNELKSLEDRRLKELPPEQQVMARAGTAPIHDGHRRRIGQRAHNRRVEALGRETEDLLGLLQQQAVREPQAAVHSAAHGTGVLQAQLRAGALTPEQFAARDQAFRRSLFAAVIQGQPAADAVADLEAGVYDEALKDAALKDFLLTQARWRLQSEAAQGEAAAGALVESARRGEAAHAVRSARTQRLLAAGDMADTELAVERTRRVRETLEQVRYAPETAVQEAVASLTPSEGAADAEERLRLQEETRLQAEAMLRERHDDPAAYVMGQPAVAEAFAAAERDPALLDDALAARLAAQAAMGLSAEERRALTRAESAEIVAGLDALPAAGRTAALGTLARHYGDQSSAVVAVLAEAGLSPVEALLLDPGGDPAGWRTHTQLVDRQRDGKQATTPHGGLIAETADRLVAEGQQATVAAPNDGAQPPEDMRLSSEWFRPKRNPLRTDESLEGRLHIPKLTGTPREQAAAVMERLELGLSPPTDEVAEDVLDLLEQLVQYRQAVRAEGLAARKRFKERLGQVGVKVYELGIDNAFAGRIWNIANETIDSAYLHPWSLSNIELTSAIGAMAAKLREDADQSVGFEIISTLADLLPVGKFARGIEYTLSAIGLGDAITTSIAQKNIWRLVNEAIHRNILVIDPQAVKDAGL